MLKKQAVIGPFSQSQTSPSGSLDTCHQTPGGAVTRYKTSGGETLCVLKTGLTLHQPRLYAHLTLWGCKELDMT